MKNILNKIFFKSNNLDYIIRDIKNLTENTPVNKIFEAVNSSSYDAEIRYVGGCIRKIINKEKVDDIDLATNLEPLEICKILKKNNINFYPSGIEHGTITAIIDEYKFEITSLRNDISTDGRHASVKFSKDWREDASRRDFSINSIYSDKDGNLFDPFNGKKDIENGLINFIGDTDKRIKEDYLRILRYLRFFLVYSKQKHKPSIIKKIKINIGGISKLSKERLIQELRKITKLDSLEKLSKDKISLELTSMIFPELKNIDVFSQLNSKKREILKDSDFIFLLSLLIIDGTDNAEYFTYKFRISKKDQKRIHVINDFYKTKINSKTYTEHNMNKIFYYQGKQTVIDIINFRIIRAKKTDEKLLKLSKNYQNKLTPIIPISAEDLMIKYQIPEGKQIGNKLRLIEAAWVENNFQISEQKVENIIKS
ncbi:CCA tRNA nucleotidyltransferase [Pelagibacterales bacterium SAG-MED13]|nr:CCA tRNA nucleotidyltransferase [Pelagibacterales bacterium SAG-MED13]